MIFHGGKKRPRRDTKEVVIITTLYVMGNNSSGSVGRSTRGSFGLPQSKCPWWDGMGHGFIHHQKSRKKVRTKRRRGQSRHHMHENDEEKYGRFDTWRQGNKTARCFWLRRLGWSRRQPDKGSFIRLILTIFCLNWLADRSSSSSSFVGLSFTGWADSGSRPTN